MRGGIYPAATEKSNNKTQTQRSDLQLLPQRREYRSGQGKLLKQILYMCVLSDCLSIDFETIVINICNACCDSVFCFMKC